LRTSNHRFCRFIGTLFGLELNIILLWWYWPEAHHYIWNPVSVFMLGASLLCDVTFPFVLYQVRKTEIRLPDGRLVRGGIQGDEVKAKVG
jgi:hypothetical protein